MIKRTYRRAAGALVVALAMSLSACSGGTTQGAPAAAGDVSEDADAQSVAAAGKPTRDPGAPPATRREDFLPLLKAEHARMTWPDAYNIAPETMWDLAAAVAADTSLTAADAHLAVQTWDICAWTLQVIDDVTHGGARPQTIAALEGLAGLPDTAPALPVIVDEARLDSISTARQFVEANGCRQGFVG